MNNRPETKYNHRQKNQQRAVLHTRLHLCHLITRRMAELYFLILQIPTIGFANRTDKLPVRS